MKGKVILSNKDFMFAAIACADGEILIVEALNGDRFSVGNGVNTRGLGYAEGSCHPPEVCVTSA